MNSLFIIPLIFDDRSGSYLMEISRPRQAKLEVGTAPVVVVENKGSSLAS